MVFDFLLKRYRKSITHRERSKDMLVLITHKLRLCYRKLGDILVDQGRIPDARLIFFMSQYETRNICEKNCPEIVHKWVKYIYIVLFKTISIKKAQPKRTNEICVPDRSILEL